MGELEISALYDTTLTPIEEKIERLIMRKQYIQSKWTGLVTLRALFDPSFRPKLKQMGRIIEKLDNKIIESQESYNSKLEQLNAQFAPRQLTEILESQVPASYYGWRPYLLPE